MNIVVEGPDNSGKTTLIGHLRRALGIPVSPGEGPERYPGEINERVERLLVHRNSAVIFDRHPVISQPIYNRFRRNGTPIRDDLTASFYDSKPFIVYCVGRGTLEDHDIKEHDQRTDADGVRHEDLVNKNHAAICQLYNDWARDHASVVYRIGDGFSRITQMLAALTRTGDFDPVADVEDFHHKFMLGYDGPPRVLPRDLADFRLKFLAEELDEYALHEAAASAERFIANKPDLANYAHHLEHMLDALVDEVYVALGTAYLHGFDFRTAWRRVQAANMKKVRCERLEDSKRGSTHDVIKPLGWTPPSHIDLVEVNDLSSKQR